MPIFTVYALYSINFQKIYIGVTSNLLNRFKSHNLLATKGYTKHFRPWIVVYTEVFHSKKKALDREKQLKSASGRKFIWNIVEEFLNS